MLVLTRRTDQQIQIGSNVTVTIVRVKGSTVRLGIEAPGEVHVVRGELLRPDQPKSAGPRPQSSRDGRVGRASRAAGGLP